ncbi:MAG: hypothetical protein K0R57_4517 [Paenibacillaceae bacterium]|jgi:chromosome segregation ATPase|nr:hypothetical protein [Paenibacillaceae bacterium]
MAMEELLQRILTEVQDIKQGQQEMNERLTRLESGQVRLESRQAQLEEGQVRLESRQAQLEEGQVRLESRQAQLEENQLRLEQKVDGIYQAVVRIEEGQPLDIFALLENIDRKLDRRDSEIAVLNKRVFKLESDMERWSHQQDRSSI